MCVPGSGRGLCRELADRRQGQEPHPLRANVEPFDWFHRSYDNPVHSRCQPLLRLSATTDESARKHPCLRLLRDRLEFLAGWQFAPAARHEPPAAHETFFDLKHRPATWLEKIGRKNPGVLPENPSHPPHPDRGEPPPAKAPRLIPGPPPPAAAVKPPQTAHRRSVRRK